MSTETAPDQEHVEPASDMRFADVETVVETRDAALRELDIRIIPWNTVITHQFGPEMFERGAFAEVDPRTVLLKAPDGAAGHQGPVVGKGMSLQERDDGAYMTFRVSKTQAGDELLTLVADEVIKGASVGFIEKPGGTSIQNRNGRRVRVQQNVGLDHVIATWRPAYADAGVVAMRSQPIQPEGVTPVPTEAAVEEATRTNADLQDANLRLMDRLEKLDERNRQEIIIPAPRTLVEPGKDKSGEWVSLALRLMTGERVSDIQMRAMADLITTDNVGVVPDAISRELIGIIDPARPFLETTRELPTPDSGMTLTVPVLAQRPTTGVQAAEKDDITSTITRITTTGFDAVTVAGGGDISIQLLKRSSPSYLDLYLRLLAEAYAGNAEELAVATLLDSGVTPGTGYIDPEDLEIGEAWTNSVSVSRLLRPDHIWMSTAAIQAFIDAKANGTNAPLYSNLAADITVGAGAQGFVSGLRPVYVPALDGSGADVLIGPSRGFAWAEDGAFTLQVDVPSKAGRDVAIVGILWFAPLYPAAFTSYRLAS